MIKLLRFTKKVSKCQLFHPYMGIENYQCFFNFEQFVPLRYEHYFIHFVDFWSFSMHVSLVYLTKQINKTLIWIVFSIRYWIWNSFPNRFLGPKYYWESIKKCLFLLYLQFFCKWYQHHFTTIVFSVFWYFLQFVENKNS